ncbi:MFS transporter [Microbacterium oleivorans]|uniref:Major facilitator superfamily MFS_1 n=1 Tax=Microbacterium oleivorans TaxID=273677 RepID=A0A031FNX1_9MICO|nr:MFS transporter [Microbacterium oleivorans]AZS44555.1 Inner membrane transport protein YdhP [Microbacterium oleivorans]EZP25997.1 Major facilitator superfamily MFS_1 [Microbacterium oleivorans]
MTSAPDRPRRALLALAIGSFGIGMTEFVVMGLLPEIARELLPSAWATSQEDAIAQAGWLITLYALGVVIGAPTIAASVAKYPRHRVMILLAGALTLFNALTLVLPTFELVAASRLLAGLPHGAYFGIGALVAADVMGPGNRAKGVAFVLTGLTVANVVGVPLGTFLGQNLGWRWAFVLVVVIFAAATVAIALTVPHRPGEPSRTLRAELAVFRIGQVWFALGIGAIGFGGFFAVYTYVSPLVTEAAGAPAWLVPIVLVILGLGMTAGNLVGGHLADVNLIRAMFGLLILLVVTQLLLALTSGWIVTVIVFVFAVAFASSAVSPTIQTRLMDVAGDNQSIAAALNHSALNTGNALGAALGGAVIAAGLGFTAPVWVGLALALGGLGIAALSIGIERRTQTRVPARV